MIDTSSSAPRPLKLIGMAVLGAVLGGVATFPLAALAFFEWRAASPSDTAWGLWALLIGGIGGGVLFALSKRFPERPRKWSRRVLALLGVPVILGWIGLILLAIQDWMSSKP